MAMRLKSLGIMLALIIGAADAQIEIPSPHPGFDVVSIKQNTSGVTGVRVGPIMIGRFNATNITVNHLIQLAYNVPKFEVLGLPSWTESATFDITAKAEGMDDAKYEQMRPLLQSLLADRFGLLLHRETKEVPIYRLVVAKGGPKLVATHEGSCAAFDPRNPPPPQPGGALPRICGANQTRRNSLQTVGSRLPDLAANLSGILGRPVVDNTSLAGRFDVYLKFAPDNAIAIGAQRSQSDDLFSPSIFVALQEQLGLKLESSKGPIQVLIVDHVERPSDN
jgi:uncharacterized protein (TIGR03435 family)